MALTYALPFSRAEVERLNTLHMEGRPAIHIPNPLEMLAQRGGNADFVFYTLGDSSLLSVGDGRVVLVEPKSANPTYPEHAPNVIIDLGNGVLAKYTHIIPLVGVGDAVPTGQQIGTQDPDYHPTIKQRVKHTHVWFTAADNSPLSLEVLLELRG